MPTATLKTASDAQIDYLTRLLACTMDNTSDSAVGSGQAWLDKMREAPVRRVSVAIDTLRARTALRPMAPKGTGLTEALKLAWPAQAPLPVVREGRYAVEVAPGDWQLYQVKTRIGGGQYVLRWTAVSVHYEPKAQQIIPLIAADEQGAAAQFGQRTGTCGDCGRALSDPESVARGIGPVCLKKW